MFNNLIESSSHRNELKRRGSFLFFTMLGYGLLFVLAGVVSIQAVDARLNEQEVDLVTMMPLVDLPVQPAPPKAPPSTPQNGANNNPNRQNFFVRKIAMDDASDPRSIPKDISAEPNSSLPVPKTGIVQFGGPEDSDPGGGRKGSGDTEQGTTGARKNQVVAVTEPPPSLPVQKPIPRILQKRVINGEAIVLPKPPYPEIARRIGAQGTVLVQVLIDISGKVVSAQVVSGHPLLAAAAKNAAYQARFAPTMIGDQPVKVSGLITYNFVINR